ncbi:MAG: ABC transporter permease [Acetobacteraceae bacterium]|nr:ABC transporter permease [Acetobacteraceae bacterium]
MPGSPADPPPSGATLAISEAGGATVLRFAGTLDSVASGTLWLRATRAAAGKPAVVLDLAQLAGCDTTGAALLAELAESDGAEIRAAGPQVQALLDRVQAIGPAPPPPAPPALTWREVLRGGLVAALGGVAFLGETLVALVRLPARARQFRRADLLRTADQAGVQAVPLIVLLGTLMGLILAFQSLVPMQRFGADIFVANLVAISLIRELGPLLAAVILAGRTGSAFAAEIGTMKVNQEIDALATMDIDPVTMLVLPRMLAAMLVMPALTVLLEMSGLLGMTLVMVGAGYPPVTVANQVAQWVQPADFFGGLSKAVVFGAVVAGIGCRAGLATGNGPRAVGLSATSAVVGGIVATIVLDGLFAVVFYRLGI